MIQIPIILSTVVAGGGAVKGIRGYYKMKDAKRINQQVKDALLRSKQNLDTARNRCNEMLGCLGKQKLEISSYSIHRFIEAFKKIKNYEYVSSKYVDELNSFVLDKSEMITLETEVANAKSIAQGVLTGSATGLITAYGAYSAVGMFVSRALNPTIKTLSGVAAKNATLAWLGGGAISAGGAGMAGGTVVLGSIMLAPALLVSGLIISSKGSKALDEALANYAKAKKASEELKAACTLCKGITAKCKAFISVLNKLDQIYLPQINRLEEIIERCGTDYATYSLEDRQAVAKAYATTGAIKAVLDTPILTEDGRPTSESRSTLLKIKAFLENE